MFPERVNGRVIMSASLVVKDDIDALRRDR